MPLDKPGCVLNVIHENLPGWPCANWYRWAVQEDRKLHPMATIVSFELSTQFAGQPEHDHRRAAGRTCAGRQPRPARRSARPDSAALVLHLAVGGEHAHVLRAATQHVRATHAGYRGDGGADAPSDDPDASVVLRRRYLSDDHRQHLTLRDLSHFTMEYSALLGSVLGLELKPILGRLEHR